MVLSGGEALPEERSLATGPAAPPATEVLRRKVLPPRAPARVSARPEAAPPRQEPKPPRAPAPLRAAPEPTREQSRPEFGEPWLLLVTGVLVAGVAGLIGRRLGQTITSDGGSWEHAVFTVLRRAEIWGVIGLALGAWLGLVRTRSREAWGVALTGALIGLLAGALGGLIVAPTDVVDSVKESPGSKDILQAASLAVEGGLIGALIGRFWRPPSGTLGWRPEPRAACSPTSPPTGRSRTASRSRQSLRSACRRC